jgi:hypothetical protein
VTDPPVQGVCYKGELPASDLWPARHMPRTLHHPVKLKNSNCVRSLLLPAGGCFLPVAGQARSFQKAHSFLSSQPYGLSRSETASDAGTGGKGAPGRGDFSGRRGTNIASSQTLPVSTPSYFSTAAHKNYCCSSPLKKWLQL